MSKVCSVCGRIEGSKPCRTCNTLYINWIPKKKDVVIYGLKEAREIKEMGISDFLMELKSIDAFVSIIKEKYQEKLK